MIKNLIVIFGLLFSLLLVNQALAREQIHIVGSSTVFGFATAVAENFGKTSTFKTPIVESTGSGGGLKLFCQGLGVGTADVTNSSRAIKKSEQQLCAKNKVNEIVEVKIGYDGIVIANAKKSQQMNLTLKQLFLALAKELPNGQGAYIKNPYKKWSDIDKSLPAVKIEVLGPPPTSGTRDAFAELAMEGGAKQIPELKKLRSKNKKAFVKIAHSLREDGAYIEAGENDNLIIQKLVANPRAFGIFGFSFLDQNTDVMQGSKINGVSPEFEKIAGGQYPLSRSLFFYLKKAHVGVIPGLREYLHNFTSERTWSEDGYLVEKGLIPLTKKERAAMAKKARQLEVLAPLN